MTGSQNDSDTLGVVMVQLIDAEVIKTKTV